MNTNTYQNPDPGKTLKEFFRREAIHQIQEFLLASFGLSSAFTDDEANEPLAHSSLSPSFFIPFIEKLCASMPRPLSPHIRILDDLPGGLKVFVIPLVECEGGKILFLAGPYREKTGGRKKAESRGKQYHMSSEDIEAISAACPVIESETVAMLRGLCESYTAIITKWHEEYENSKNHQHQVSSLYRIFRSLYNDLPLRDILYDVLRFTAHLYEAQKASMFSLDEETGNLESLASYSAVHGSAGDTVIPHNEGVADMVVKTGKSEIYHHFGHSSMWVPLIAQGKTLGVFTVSDPKNDRKFSEQELDLLEAIAAGCAMAINYTGLYESLRRKLQEQAMLVFITNAISSSLDLDTVLQEVLDKAIRMLDARKGSLMLIEEETQEMRIVNAVGLSPDIVMKTRIIIGEGISGKVARDGMPILIKKGVKLADSHSTLDSKELKSAISVPVEIKGKIIGVLNISDQIRDENFINDHVGLLQMLANQAAIAIENSRLHMELKDLFIGSVKALINAIEARDPYTKGHSIRVTHYSMKIAQALKMRPEEVENLHYASLLHDIGKINVKDEILLKPGKLTYEERAAIQEHPKHGALIMRPVKAFQKILPFLYHHHETYSGTGYPQHISGKTIPVESRIITVADSFDAMTSDRPYRKALKTEEAISELQRNAGTQFDPEIVRIFIHLIETDASCNPENVTESLLI
ncbi:MAG: GAF domain-containing protein [Candidatus Eremiobacteraeota bacterium]|nr:GAF domain-containing protein [Candidatus Eremiobacteraeota bacterium]